jgi:hypothetical protein
VEVRLTPGGPAPSETARAIAQSREAVVTDRLWLSDTNGRLAAAQARLRQRAQAL